MFNRIKEARTSLNISQREFGEQLGLRQSTINDIEHNRCNINERLIISICARFNINEQWLRTGHGSMFNIIDKQFDEFFAIYSKLSKPLQDFLFATALELLNAQNKL